MYYINYYSHQDSHLFCASIWIHLKKISFKPITSKTEIWTVFTALCLKKQKNKYPKRGGAPQTL